jgi:hypothetical protein
VVFARVLVLEGPPDARAVTAARDLADAESVDVGREGALPMGVTVPNTAISRVAVSVRITEHGWDIAAPNRNGAVLYPWGQAATRADRETSVRWPRIGIRVLPDASGNQHWVLLETDQFPPRRYTSPGGISVRTDLADPPGELTAAERAALLVVFEQDLSWPPHRHPEPLLLKQASRRLGLSVSGVQDRLKAARTRAIRLGYLGTGGSTDPGYLYVLVRAGHLDPPQLVTNPHPFGTGDLPHK